MVASSSCATPFVTKVSVGSKGGALPIDTDFVAIEGERDQLTARYAI